MRRPTTVTSSWSCVAVSVARVPSSNSTSSVRLGAGSRRIETHRPRLGDRKPSDPRATISMQRAGRFGSAYPITVGLNSVTRRTRQTAGSRSGASLAEHLIQDRGLIGRVGDAAARDSSGGRPDPRRADAIAHDDQ